jgi:UV excision repair protein RAD23
VPSLFSHLIAPAQLNPEAIRQLTDMGFPQDQAEAALRAAMGNSDLAVEYLMSGIPDSARNAPISTPTGSGTPAASPAGSGSGIEQLRRHPQLNELRRLVQQNPAALSQVLEAIGQQNPDLLRLIHGNQAEFLAMMNEPITEEAPPQAPDFGGGGDGNVTLVDCCFSHLLLRWHAQPNAIDSNDSNVAS